MNTAVSPEKSLADIGDIAQDANNVVAKILLQCGKPDLAADVKSVFERLMVMNMGLGAALAGVQMNDIGGELEELNVLVQTSVPSVAALAEMHTLIMSKSVSDRMLAVAYVRGLVSTLASLGISDIDLDSHCHTQPADAAVDYETGAATKDDWQNAKREREVLLALLRGYRFLIEASPESLSELGTTRTQMLARVRALETKAAVEGIAC